MATEKKITSRIQQKHDVAANWAKATNFIPKKGEIIIYDAEYNASGEETQAVRFKIGDGSKTVNNLPFAVIDYSSDIETLEQEVANNSTAIGALQENTVPKTRKINNKALSSDITLGAADVGVNETTFPGLKKTGTVTGVKMNGTTKNPSSGVVDLGTVLTDASVFATSAQGTKADNAMPKSGGTFTGEVKFGSTENFQGYYIKRMLGSLGIGTAYNNLDSSYKDGTYHRMWRLRFPSGSSFWGKIKVTLYGDYSSFNASGLMSKSITCNFNTSNIYNNVGCYDGLGVNVERDFRISEAIWNATANAWEVLIWQKNLNGNNPATIMLECWTKNNTNYINAFNGIAAQAVELTRSTSYSAQKASPTGGTKTVEWATLPVYENPLGEEIATVAMLEDKQDKITSCEAISLANADWEMSGGYNIVPKKPLVDGYEGMLCFNLEVIPHPLEINWDNATAWGDIQNAVGVRLFSFTYEGETQDVCFVEFPAGTEINNTVLTFSAYAIWLGTIIPLWADTEFWKAYGDGGLVGAISANDTGWVKYDVLPVYGNYMRFIVAVSITNIANQDIWGSYITGEQLWTKKPASEFSWSEIYPYYYSATKTLSSIPVTGSEVALLCDSVAEADIRLCASCGVTIGKVDGANITFYAIDKPYKNLTLFVEYAK